MKYVDVLAAMHNRADASWLSWTIGARLADGAEIPVIPAIHAAVWNAVSPPGALAMQRCHSSCGTAHCRAGWVTHLAGAAGAVLEGAVGCLMAARLIYAASDPSMIVYLKPDFHCSNLEALRSCAEMAGVNMPATPA